MSPHVVFPNDLSSSISRRTLTALASVLVLAAPATAQIMGTVTGRVTDASSGAPIADAQVRVIGTTTGVMTRMDGSYRLALAPGRHELRVSRIGYAAARDSVVLDAAVTVTKDFRLEQTGLALDQIVVTGTPRWKRRCRWTFSRVRISRTPDSPRQAR